MKTKAVKITFWGFALMCLIGVGLLGTNSFDQLLGFQQHPASALAAASNDSESTATTLYLPTVVNNYPFISTYGVQLEPVSVAGGLEKMQQAGAYWIRRNGLLWSDIESTQGVRDWSKADGLANEISAASSSGMNMILIVRSAPAWAADQSCGPVYRDQFAAFGSFLADAVARFSRPPYNVLYYEIWNEPDVDPSSVRPDQQFGCWADINDPYFGGGYYGDMLKVVYPMVKAANPDAQIVIGGLLLACDPTQPSLCGAAPNAGKYLEGILRSTGGNSFDGVAFHAYDYFGDPLNVGKYANLSWGSQWNNEIGPVTNAKATYVKNLLNSYNVSGKFLMNTEAALIDVPDNCSNCEATKAYYLAQTFASAKKQGLLSNLWYSFFGWRGSQLADSLTSTLPAYTAYQVSQNQLGNAAFIQNITSYANVNVLVFSRGQETVWFVWSRDGANHPITLPKTPVEIVDVYGASHTPVDQNYTVTIQPNYLVFSP